MKKEGCCITPLEDLKNSALKHYQEASISIHHWNSDIPKAIKFYYNYKQMNFFEKIKQLFNHNL